MQVLAEEHCKQYFSKGKQNAEISYLEDAIAVEDAFQVNDVRMTIDLTHKRVGALVVSLTAQPFAGSQSGVHRVVMLKERGSGQLGTNMYMTTFSDSASKDFPTKSVSL